MNLTVVTDLSGTITRQQLVDMWSNATIPPVQDSDLDPAFAPIFVGSGWSDVGASVPNPEAGQLFWNQSAGMMYVFTDHMDVLDGGTDNTAISLWLGIGPDTFECACLAAEPIPAGAVVEPYYDRWVKIFRPDAGDFAGVSEAPAPLGINQSGIPNEYDPVIAYGDTAASGTWIRVCIDGYGRIWHPRAVSGVSETVFSINVITTQFNYVGCPPASTAGPYLGAGIGNGNGATDAGPYTVGLTIHNVTVPSGYTAAYPYVSWRGWGCERFRPDLL
jgi:hypothetical protein